MSTPMEWAVTAFFVVILFMAFWPEDPTYA